MLQRLINSARVNVFESARFYYWVLMVLIIHAFTRQVFDKYLAVDSLNDMLFSKQLTAYLYFFVTLLIVISILSLKNIKNWLFFITFFTLILIGLLNEYIYSMEAVDYSLKNSILKGQLYYLSRLTFPMIFLFMWTNLEGVQKYESIILSFLEKIILLNSIFIILGIFFDVSFFESYYGSQRWGYSGFMAKGYNVILSSIFFIRIFNRDSSLSISSMLLICSLIFSGTKAGILSVILIILFVILKNIKYRLLFSASVISSILLLPFWIKYIVSFSSFWSSVYEDNGAWDTLFSFRNKILTNFIETFECQNLIMPILFGGNARFPDLWVEILPVDIFAFFGSIGFFVFFALHLKYINQSKLLIPMFIAFGNGSFFIAPLAIIVWWVWINENKNISFHV